MAEMNKSNSGSSDPFEEFEFRPINEGLGFHNKKKMQTNQATSASISSTAASFSAPLPRAENSARPRMQIPTIEDDSIAKAQTAVNEILKNLNQKRSLEFVNETEKQRDVLKKSKPFFFAATLDAMLITAVFLMSMIVMLTVTKVDLFMNLTHPETSNLVFAATAGLFLAITI